MNELCHGSRIDSEDWRTWFETPEARIKEVYSKWLALRKISGGLR